MTALLQTCVKTKKKLTVGMALSCFGLLRVASRTCGDGNVTRVFATSGGGDVKVGGDMVLTSLNN